MKITVKYLSYLKQNFKRQIKKNQEYPSVKLKYRHPKSLVFKVKIFRTKYITFIKALVWYPNSKVDSLHQDANN